MISSRTQAVTFVFFVALVVFFFTYWATTSLISSKTALELNSNQEVSDYKTLGQDNQKKADPVSSVKFNLVDKSSGINISANSSDNLTQLVSNNISSEFIAKSKESPDKLPSEILNGVDANSLISKKLSDVLEQSTVLLVEDIPNSNLNIINDTSSESVQKYIQQYMSAISRLDGFFIFTGGSTSYINKVMDDAFRNNDYVGLDRELVNNASVVKTLESMQVPLPAVGFHKQSLMFLKILSVFLSSMKNIYTDPLKAYLVMDKGMSIIEQQGESAIKAFQQLKIKYNIR